MAHGEVGVYRMGMYKFPIDMYATSSSTVVRSDVDGWTVLPPSDRVLLLCVAELNSSVPLKLEASRIIIMCKAKHHSLLSETLMR